MNTPTPAISIKNLSKAYKVYEKASDVLQETIFGRGKFQTVHALKDINLDVYPGEVLGILGANGCLLYTSPSPRDQRGSRMPSSA